MKTLLTALTAAALASVLVVPAALAQADPASVVQRLIDAHNRGDVAGVMALFTDDAVLEGSAPCNRAPCVGKAAIQPYWERQVADHTRVTPTTPQVAGSTVTVRAEVRADRIRAAGIERLITRATVEISGDKIAAFRTENDPADPETAAFLGVVQAQPAAPAPAPLPRALPRTGDAGTRVRGRLGAAAALLAAGLALFIRRKIAITQ